MQTATIELARRIAASSWEAVNETSGDEAVRALVGLGYTPGAAEDAVRAVLAAGGSEETPQLIRRALQRLATRGGS